MQIIANLCSAVHAMQASKEAEKLFGGERAPLSNEEKWSPSKGNKVTPTPQTSPGRLAKDKNSKNAYLERLAGVSLCRSAAKNEK